MPSCSMRRQWEGKLSPEKRKKTRDADQKMISDWKYNFSKRQKPRVWPNFLLRGKSIERVTMWHRVQVRERISPVEANLPKGWQGDIITSLAVRSSAGACTYNAHKHTHRHIGMTLRLSLQIRATGALCSSSGGETEIYGANLNSTALQCIPYSCLIFNLEEGTQRWWCNASKKKNEKKMWVRVTAVSLILWAAELRKAESKKECDKPLDWSRKRKEI